MTGVQTCALPISQTQTVFAAVLKHKQDQGVGLDFFNWPTLQTDLHRISCKQKSEDRSQNKDAEIPALPRSDFCLLTSVSFFIASPCHANYRDGLLELAALYEKNHQNAEAIAIYQQFPENAAAQAHVGQILLESRHSADAIAPLEAAMQKDPTPANQIGRASCRERV